ncbi:MAG: hypothetical protein C0485_18300 [Pirellula sp.]|nr:hypothetical protein [Pirellula sp.]
MDVASYWAATIAGVSIAGAVFGTPFLLIGALFGFLIAGFFSIALVVPFALAVRGLCGSWRHPLAAPCFGGLIGFVSCAGWRPLSIERPEEFFYFLAGPILASFVGQAGGYVGARNIAIEMTLQQPSEPQSTPWRFTIRSALIVMVSVALLLTLLRAWRPLELPDLYIIAMWLPCQVGMLCLFARLGRRAAAKVARTRAVSRETGGYALLPQ